MYLCRIISIYLLCGFSWASCTIKDPLYCNEQTPCPEEQRCNLKTSTCEPRVADAGPDRGAHLDRGVLPPNDTVLDLTNGASCSADHHCASKICADGVCCLSRCEGSCRSCALAGKRGECALAGVGEDPRQDCASSHAMCEGSCDGHGVCTFPAEETNCETTSCRDGELTLAQCNGRGECVAQKDSCDGYACDAAGLSCRQGCATNAECTGTFQCVGQNCVNQLALGADCGDNDLACDSKHCVDSVCCQSDSCAPCHACNLAAPVGQCAPVLDGTSCGTPSCNDGILTTSLCASANCATQTTSCAPYACNPTEVACLTACGLPQDCAADAYCESTLCLPKKENGQRCNNAQECLSQICTAAEGVCCDNACAGECETCAGLSQCTPLPANTPCGSHAPFCDDGPDSSVVKIEQCDGNRNCVAKATSTCDPYRCTNLGGNAICGATCATAAECTSWLCDLVDQENTCVPASQICYATPSGSATCPGNGSRADPHCTIQACLDSGKAYLALADGTYPENLIARSDVHLIATGAVPGALPSTAIIPPGSYADGLNLTGGHKVYLYGLDLSFPAPSVPPLTSDPGGPLIHTDKQAEVILKASRVHRGNKAPCLLNKNSTLSLRDVTIDACGKGGISSEATELNLDNVILFQNADYGIYQDWGLINMKGVTFRSNSGISLQTFHAHLTLDRIRAFANKDVVFSLNNSTTGLIANMLSHDNDGSTLVFSNNATPPLILHLTSIKNTGVEVVCDNAINIFNSILWDSDAVMYSGNCSFSYSAIKNGASGVMNISNDPQFNNVAPEPFSLSSTSPCIDAASDTAPVSGTYPAQDVAGNPRQVDLVPGGKVYDMGAFERQ